MTFVDSMQDDNFRARVGDKLDQRVAFVTGGTRGIGAAICRSLASQGATLAAGYAGNDVAAEKFRTEFAATYRILSNGKGGFLHLAKAEDGWLVPGKNPCGLYLYAEDVDALAAAIAPDVLGKGPEDKPWGMYEFSLSDPDQTLVRVGWPTRLRTPR